MKEITITIKTTNKAFQNGKEQKELSYILQALAYAAENGTLNECMIGDTNGKECGKVEISE